MQNRTLQPHLVKAKFADCFEFDGLRAPILDAIELVLQSELNINMHSDLEPDEANRCQMQRTSSWKRSGDELWAMWKKLLTL